MAQADDPLDEARSIIDRKIALLEERIQVLKSRRNELSPISRLPTKILCNIFEFSLTDDSLLSRTQRAVSWTNFSQVSRHWRSSALNAPELWTDIPLTQEMLICSAGSPLNEARTRIIIDRNIALLEESIQVLKSRRNELSPIYRLPIEILCNIFEFSFFDYFSLSRTHDPKFWTNFSQVSRHWRSSALNASELWTDIPLRYPRWTQEMLKRSKMALLTIRTGRFATLCPKLDIETVRSCLYEMKRVGEIELHMVPGSILEEIFRDLPKSAPQLHTLCIYRFYGNAFSTEDFLHDTERLQHVDLLDCKISWDSRLLTGLTRLTLDRTLKANSSINQVLHALRRMPALTDLRLIDSIPDDSEGPSTYAVVDLPCLRVLNISSGVGALTAVLRHISFPLSTILNLTCKENQSTQIDFSNFLSVLATKFLVIRSLRLGVPGDLNGIEIHLWTDTLTQHCFRYSLISQSRIHLVLSWPWSQPPQQAKTLTCVFDAMNLSLLTQLHISVSGVMDIDSQTWVETFGRLPRLERVCVKGLVPHPFFNALVYKTKAAEKSKTAYCNVSFPKLRYIHLLYTSFWPNPHSQTISVDMLLDCLMERYERNAEVHVLRLEDCYYISSVDVKRLKEVVDVIWDGKVRPSS